MRIDLPTPDVWNTLCDDYRSRLQAGVVQLYGGYAHALWEITQGLAKLFSHKKTIAIIGESEPAIENAAIELSREGYAVKNLKWSEVGQPSEWLDPIQNDLLFVLFAKDDPITGRIFDTSHINTVLKDKRVFRISLSHFTHRFAPNHAKPELFEVGVLSLTPERALVVAGDRCRVSPVLAPLLPWSLELLNQIDADLALLEEKQKTTWEAKVLELESQLPAGFETYFAKGEMRIPDRAVFFHPQLDGFALMERFAHVKQIAILPPGLESKLESTSACRWQSPRLSTWLANRGEAEDKVRGLILVSAEAIDDQTAAQLSQIAQEIRTLQDGE